MLGALLAACDGIGISADPSSVVTDFEAAAMNAVRAKLGPDVAVRGCFFTCARRRGGRYNNWASSRRIVTMKPSASTAA